MKFFKNKGDFLKRFTPILENKKEDSKEREILKKKTRE